MPPRRRFVNVCDFLITLVDEITFICHEVADLKANRNTHHHILLDSGNEGDNLFAPPRGHISPRRLVIVNTNDDRWWEASFQVDILEFF